MSKIEMAKSVLALVTTQRKYALDNYIDTVGKLSAARTSSSLWRAEPDNALSRNPYNVELAEKRMKNAMEELERRDEIVKFVTETFIQKAYE